MRVRTLFVIGTIAACCVSAAFADVKLASVFTDNMVLQRDLPAVVWGKAVPGEFVSVSFAGQTQETKAAADGRWQVKLTPLQSSRQPAELTVAGKNRLVIKNVLVGEVWLCSGQSNMEMGIGQVNNAQAEIADANRPMIRLFMVPNTTALMPKKEITGAAAWAVCTPMTVASNGWGGFSAAGYFFGRELNKELDVPVGLIESDWGGTPAQAWTPLASLEAAPSLAHYVAELKKFSPVSQDEIDKQAKERAKLDAEMQQRAEDPGNQGEADGWQNADTDLSSWERVKVPNGWFTSTNIYGSVWFRRDVEVPAAWAGKDVTLNLGVVDDYDTTYFNGRKIGATGKETKEWWTVSRRYTVPGELVKAGRNTIAVRVFNDYMSGGFTSGAEALVLTGPSGVEKPAIKLAGSWSRKVEKAVKTFPVAAKPPSFQNCASCLYNAMIAPLVPFAIRGAIWYQGESNAGKAYEYRTLFPTMIGSWRSAWGEGDFPFYFVQLANYMPAVDQPADSNWAELREAQSLTLGTTNTGMAVIIDIGDAGNIHPKNKQEVGRRLALNALATTYGKKVEYSGPVVKTVKTENGAVRIAFSHANGGLKTRDGQLLQGFAICGADHKFVWATATIEGDAVVVTSPTVAAPVAVRYAWANNPACNLVNADNLPASPFRTDTFKGITEPAPAP